MSRLPGRSSRRFLLRHPWQLMLALAGIAGGVAVVVGVDLANDSALRAMTRSTELVAGRATHQLIGVGGRVPESLVVRLRTELGVHDAAPVLETGAHLAGAPVTLVGIDALGESVPGFAAGPPGRRPAGFWRLIAEPRTIVVPRALAARLAIEAGDRAMLEVGGRRVEVQVVGLVTPEAAALADAAGLVMTDIATAQELLESPGELSRIDLRLDPSQAAALADIEFDTAELVPAGAQVRALVEMTRAFRVNLTALSLLGLVVGAFLIHNTVAFLALRRRSLFGLLRVLGVERRALFRFVLGEGLAIGLAGSLAGLLLGALLAGGLLHLVARSITDLYFDIGDVALHVSLVALAKGLTLGIGVSLLAAWLPARDAAARQPRVTLNRRSVEAGAHARLPKLMAGAVAAALLGVLSLLFPGRSLVAAFFGLFCIIAAAALATPGATVLFLRAAGRCVRSLAGRYAARSAIAGLSRTGTAVAALAVAVAAVVGIGLMIESFRGTVADWLEATLSADFYVTADPNSGRSPDDALAHRLAALAGVRAVSRTRRSMVGGVHVWGIDPGASEWRPRLLTGDPAQAWQRVMSGEAVLVSEAYASRRGTKVGDALRLTGPHGRREQPVAGVFADFATDQGVVAMSLDGYRMLSGDETLTGAGVFLDPRIDPRATRARIDDLIGGGRDGLRVASSGDIRDASMAIFERTFRITGVLRLLAGCIAALGIYSALQALALERRREIAVLRAIGATPAQVSAQVLAQTALLGLSAAAVALPLGIVLAWLLVHVINNRAFGWSLGFELAPGMLWQGVGLALGTALIAGLQPAIALARGRPATALREE